MSNTPKGDGPQPTEELGLAELTDGEVIHQKSGYDSSLSSAKAEEGGVLPPSKMEEIPQTSLAERIRQGRSGKGGAK